MLSLGAGLSTMLGTLFIFIGKSKSQRLVSISLGFAAGVMTSVSFTDLLPNAQKLLMQFWGKQWGIVISVVFLIAGILLAVSLDHFVPHQEFDADTGETPHQNLFRIGFISMLAIGLHNFPEGIATFMAGYGNFSIGLPIAVAIALHNIPEGISVAMPIYCSTGSKKLAVKYTFLSGIAEPVGALLVFLFLRPFINNFVLGSIFSMVAGIMLYIAIEELIPSSRQYGHDREALIATFTGICLMPLTHILI
jgi:ZIP family zinc transporter